PILVTKMVHGQRGARGQDGDWNNDRNDARNLVEFASKVLFNGKPMAWQIFDGKTVPLAPRPELLKVTAELVQSPILYFNGHNKPFFEDDERDLIKEYRENGGLVVAEACCGRKGFHDGFLELLKNKERWGDATLKELDGNHPVWSVFYRLNPADFDK